MFRAQKVDKTPNIPDKGKAPRRMPVIYQDGYTLSLSSYHPEYIINFNPILTINFVLKESYLYKINQRYMR